MRENKEFPEGMKPLGKDPFAFLCHPGIVCYNSCCRKLDMFLYPYDIIRLKNRLSLDSEEFIRRHTRLGQGGHPFFPAVMMRMADNPEQTCPFLGENGCTVYTDRPTACRTYPLERAVDRTPERGRPSEYYFLVRHSYCLGHEAERQWTVKEWVRDQKILDYNIMSDLWTEVDTLFAQNPWQGEGAGGARQQMAFMACYNIDGFRRFADETGLLAGFKLDKARQRLISGDDEALLKFAFDWLKYGLAGQPTLRPR